MVRVRVKGLVVLVRVKGLGNYGYVYESPQQIDVLYIKINIPSRNHHLLSGLMSKRKTKTTRERNN